eukprot:1153886-Pelagomonas_calceolata.AAC.5
MASTCMRVYLHDQRSCMASACAHLQVCGQCFCAPANAWPAHVPRLAKAVQTVNRQRTQPTRTALCLSKMRAHRLAIPNEYNKSLHNPVTTSFNVLQSSDPSAETMNTDLMHTL